MERGLRGEALFFCQRNAVSLSCQGGDKAGTAVMNMKHCDRFALDRGLRQPLQLIAVQG
jgi:hypothetical protein